MSVCLDSWAVLAWLDGDEPAASAVQSAFEAGRPWMSCLNLGEVAYLLERRHDAQESARVVRRLRTSLALDELTPDRILAAAHLKAVHPIVFADCFAAATAAARGATLLTGDPELIERDIGCDVRDLRASPMA
ncbi:MAG TPA: PIN domain-containing protein [Solirubrobacteraceae bacterium]|nr:PIN domain-containing protein [Solirubrobacteraceae bacterium]HEU4367863.1 PIN domain-containing protein [Methylomirabilota bacterium]